VAHATAPLLLKRVSKKMAAPSAAAAGSSATALEWSAGNGGRLANVSDCSVANSAALHTGRRFHQMKPAPASSSSATPSGRCVRDIVSAA
jgi:hypothetical protein